MMNDESIRDRVQRATARGHELIIINNIIINCTVYIYI